MKNKEMAIATAIENAREVMESDTVQNFISGMATKAVMTHEIKGGKEYVDITSNTRSFIPEEIMEYGEKDCVVFKQNSGSGTYNTARVIATEDAMVLLEFCISTKALKPTDAARQWENTAAIIVFKNKDIVCWYNTGKYFVPTRRSALHYSFDFGKSGFVDFEEVRSALKTVWGTTVFMQSGTYAVDVQCAWHLDSMIAIKGRKTNGKKQQKIDELTAIPLRNAKEFADKLVEHNRGFWRVSNSSVAVIDDVDKEDTVCIRLLSEMNGGIMENARIYVDKTEYIVCKKNAEGDWIQMSSALQPNHWRYPLVTLEIPEGKNTKIKYLMSILEEIPEMDRMVAMITFLTQPMFESYCKTGGKEHFLSMIQRSYNTVREQMQDTFGKCNTKAKNFLGYIGLNKNQWNLIKDMPSICKAVKEITDTTDVSSLDIKTFTNIVNVLKAFYDNERYSGYSYYIAPILKNLMVRSIQTLNSATESLIAISKMPKSNNEYSMWTVLSSYRDYLDLINKMPDVKAFGWKFSIENAADDIVRMHDAAVAVYNAKKSEFQKEAFSKATPRVKKYVFEDDNYAVIAPEEPEDLANEGLKLHHCVKMYIEKVIDGRTNIMFIRKKEDMETPFFTVEISNDGVIEQIHGLKNRNLDTEPDLIPFVEKWVKEKKLKENGFNKVR